MVDRKAILLAGGILLTWGVMLIGLGVFRLIYDGIVIWDVNRLVILRVFPLGTMRYVGIVNIVGGILSAACGCFAIFRSEELLERVKRIGEVAVQIKRSIFRR
ncbi:MAG: hypothetical protein N3A38_16900 [Planctomycetota bacterium]|nr:hypothetical protein [Planctomycetota bacterium]